MLRLWPNSTVDSVTNTYQMEAINSEFDFDHRGEWTAPHLAARAGRRTWRLSLICFNPSNQSVYHLLDGAPPKPDYSGQGGPGGWTTADIAFHPQPLRLVFQEGAAGTQQGTNAHMLEADWHAHASIKPPPPQAPPPDGSAPPLAPAASAPWRLHFNVTRNDSAPEPSELVLTALENLSWA